LPPLLKITHESLIVAQEPNDKWSTIDTIQVGLDIAGYIPVIGIVADLTNAGIHLVRGNYVDAGLSAIGAIPGFGDAIKGGAKIAKAAGGVAGAVGQGAKQGAKVAEAGADFAKTCKKGSDACFTAGTQIVVGAIYDENDVFVEYITVNIEDIRVGDWVYSYNTLTGETELSQVTATFALKSSHINYLTIVDENGNEQVIETTDSHPFWIVTDEPDLERAARSVVNENGVWLYHDNIGPTEHGFWVEAKDLRVGDVFLGANGELTTLTNIVRVEQSGGIDVFNFTVAGNCNYFILAKEYAYGQTCILVHNACPHEHHIIMKGEFSGWKNKEAKEALKNSQDLLNQYKIGLNHPKNIIDKSKKILNEGHSQKYAKIVWKNLDTVVNVAKKDGKKFIAIRNAILNEIDRMGKEIIDKGIKGLK